MLRSAPAKLLALVFAISASLPAGAEGLVFNLAAAPSVSPHDIVILPDIPPSVSGAPASEPAQAGPSQFFRFLPDGPWLAFSRPLELSSAPGEERYYTIETRNSSDEAAPVRRSTILIDKRSPLPPKIDTPSGLYRETRAVKLSAEPGSTIRYSLFATAAETASFLVYDPANPPRLELPPTASETSVLLAYAEDRAGNRSGVERREYRLAPGSLAFFPPPVDASPVALTPDTLSDLASPKVYSSRGLTELLFTAPRGSRILAAVNPPSPPASPSDFLPLASDGQSARLSLSCPYGWAGKLSIYIALASDSGIRYSASPIAVSLASLPAPSAPEDPIILSGRSGGPAFLAFPAYQGRIRYAIAGGPEKDYESPVILDPAAGGVELAWYGLDSAGAKSEEQTKRLALPPRLQRIALSGVAEGEWRNGAVKLVPAAAGTIRYELTMDGSLPPEPGAGSPLLGDALTVDCPPGEERTCSIRYRSFSGADSGAVADEGTLLSFHVDRKAPEAPSLAEALPPFSTKGLSARLESAEGEIYARLDAIGIAVDGSADDGAAGKDERAAQAAFAKLDGPLALQGSMERPIEYRIRAYVVDKAGNRSAEMAPVSCVVDLATVHVAASGSDAGDGGRDRPLASLDAALALARKEGRRTILVAGNVPLSAPASLPGGDIVIIGGYSSDWRAGAGARSIVQPSFASGDKALFSVDGGRLEIRRIELGLDGAGLPSVFSARNASLSFLDSRLTLSSPADLLAFDLDRSNLLVSDSELIIGAGRSGSMIAGRGSAVKVERSRLAAGSGVKYYGALSLDGGSLELGSARLESAATLGTRLVSLANSKIAANACLFLVSGGTGFLSIGKFDSSPGTIANSRLDLDWAGGDATLFRSTGPCPAFLFDSLRAKSGSALRFFECDGAPPVIGNTIADCLAPKGELVVSRNAPKPGELFSSCLWGFQAYYLGGKTIRDLGELARFGSQSAATARKPCFVEDPALTFASAEGGAYALGPASRCVDGASAIAGYATDYSGGARSAGAGPDIGSDELK